MPKNFTSVGFNKNAIPSGSFYRHAQDLPKNQNWADGWDACLEFMGRVIRSGQRRGTLPSTPEQIREFIGSDFSSIEYGGEAHAPEVDFKSVFSKIAHPDDVYRCTAHDLMSAFANWQIFVFEEIPDEVDLSESNKSDAEHRLEACEKAAHETRLQRDGLLAKVEILEKFIESQGLSHLKTPHVVMSENLALTTS